MDTKSKPRHWIVVVCIIAALCVAGVFVVVDKAQQTASVTALERQEAKVMDWRVSKPVEWVHRVFNRPLTQAAIAKLPFAYPESVSFPATPRDGKAAADALSQLPSINSVFIFAEEPAVPDELLASLARLPKLRALDLTMANISHAGWKHIGTLTNLRELYLSENVLTDDDIQAFATLDHLEKLSLIGTKITARSVPILAKFQELKELDLSETGITAASGAQLSVALPNTFIRFAEPTATANAPR
jgi:hypothetical protein